MATTSRLMISSMGSCVATSLIQPADESSSRNVLSSHIVIPHPLCRWGLKSFFFFVGGGGGFFAIPDLLCLFGKQQGKPPKGQGFLLLAEPPKSLGKKGKTLKIARNSLGRQKARKTKKTRKRRLGIFQQKTKKKEERKDRAKFSFKDKSLLRIRLVLSCLLL